MKKIMSPSSRRAWIEMVSPVTSNLLTTSPSSRRAWIEINSLFDAVHYLSRRPPRGGRG